MKYKTNKKTFKSHKADKSYKKTKLQINKLTQDYYIDNPSVIQSFNYYNHIKNNIDIPTNAEMVDLITSYQNEFEPDEWEEHPLPLSFAFLLWLFMYKPQNKLGEFNIITPEQRYEQLDNAIKLNEYLHTFPKSTNDIYVYSGYGCDDVLDGYNEETNQITYNYLVSTSLNIDVAISFANTFESINKRCLLRIKIPAGMPLAFISEKLSMTENTEDGTESEILLPIGITFTFPDGINPKIITYKGLEYNVYDMEIINVPHPQSLNSSFWNKYKDILDNVNNNHELSAGKRRKTKRKKLRRRKRFQKTKKNYKRRN
jgi:hypothetical protein